MLNGIEAQMVVVQVGAALWSDVKAWGMSKGLLSAADQGDTGRRDLDAGQGPIRKAERPND